MNSSSSPLRLIEPGFRGKRPLKYVLWVLLFALAVYYQEQYQKKTVPEPASDQPASEANQFPDRETGILERGVDGDTLIVQTDSGRWQVRLIGADTPETIKKDTPVQPFGPEASEYTKKRISEFNGRVTLAVDGDRLDRYGRRLALVYLGGGDILLNEELIRSGLARAKVQYRYSDAMKARFAEAEKQAKYEKLGIWSLPNAADSEPQTGENCYFIR